MLLGPIFRVELVSAARRRRYFALRVVYAAIILFVLWVTYSSVSRYNGFSRSGPLTGGVSINEQARAAAAFFGAFTWVQILGIMAVAPAAAVGTIASERERRTIEYLFATDLSNFEIVVGKTFARLLVVGQLVLTSLPILFIFRLLGGIPAGMLAASFLIAASTAIFLTSLSVCVSVWSPRARDAMMRVYRVLGALIILPIILAPVAMVLQTQASAWWKTALIESLDFLQSLNPLVVLGKSMSSAFAIGVGFDFTPVWRMAAWHLGLSAALVALATTAVRRVHLRSSSRGEARRAASGAPWHQRYRWKRQVGDRAMIWKEVFAPASKTKLGVLGGVANALVVVVAFGWTGYFFWEAAFNATQMDDEAFFYYSAMLTGALGTGLLLLLAARAAGLVTLEKERDCWISLLSTPLTGAEIMRGKMLGNLYSARWGFFILLITWLLAAYFDGRYLLLIPVLAATFLLANLFVTNVGLYFSLGSSTSLRAIGLTLATVFFVGGGYLFFCCFAFAVMGGDGDDSLLAIGMAPCLPFLISAPAWFFEIGVDDRGTSSMFAAYIIGMIGYGIVNMMLIADLSWRFDERAGRTVAREGVRSVDQRQSG